MSKIKIAAFSIFLIITFIFVLAFKVNSHQKYGTYLEKDYKLYKKAFMSKEGRIINYDKNNITTSEEQSYMLLQSLIMNDRKTFDLVYKWTKNNLQRKDNLFSWLWGENSNGEYRILDENSASNADVDIAFALLLASEKFNRAQYSQEAIPIMKSIWYKETRRIGRYLVLMPGSGQASGKKIEINPSYFSPYAFKYFQKYDNLHDWNRVVDSSYYYLDSIMSKTRTGLPPNWFSIHKGLIVLEKSPKSDFSYDAVRVFAKIYMDYTQTGERRAIPILERIGFLANKWNVNSNIYVNYKANGHLADKTVPPGFVSILLPAINFYDKNIADVIFEREIKPSLSSNDYWTSKKDYYDKNLLWFGYYLYDKHSK